MLIRRATAVSLLLFAALAVVTVACGSGDAATRGGVTVEALASTATSVPFAGKPAAPPTATPPPPDTPTAVLSPVSEPEPSSTPAPAPTATPVVDPGPPQTGRWIDVDVTNFVVRMMDGTSVVRELAPVGVGEQINTGAYLSTQTGLFQVYNKVEALTYDAPYDTYISHWIGFDPAKDNGFHSLLKDASGTIVDASTGRVSNGCIRVGDAEALFAFAEIGMPVYVHL